MEANEGKQINCMLMVHYAEEVCGISGKMEMIDMNKDGRPLFV